MKVIRHQYSRALAEAAEHFLIDQFSTPTQFTEASHLPDLIDAAMHIVTGAAWIQPELSRDNALLASIGELGSDEDEDEDEDQDD